MITPAFGIYKDNNLRRDTSLEKLSQLKPAFDKQNGTLTAGNSTPFTDGASAVLLASEEWAKANDLPVLAYITFSELAGIEYVENRQNLLLAPVFAAERMLKKAGMNLEDFDYYEIHEAFAAQVLATLKIWENDDLAKKFGLEKALGRIDRSKLNVKVEVWLQLIHLRPPVEGLLLLWRNSSMKKAAEKALYPFVQPVDKV